MFLHVTDIFIGYICVHSSACVSIWPATSYALGALMREQRICIWPTYYPIEIRRWWIWRLMGIDESCFERISCYFGITINEYPELIRNVPLGTQWRELVPKWINDVMGVNYTLRNPVGRQVESEMVVQHVVKWLSKTQLIDPSVFPLASGMSN